MIHERSISASVTKPLLAGKKGLILGVANNHSLAWGIAQVAVAHGAQIALSYPNEAIGKRVRRLASSLNSTTVFECDVSCDDDIDNLFDSLAQTWPDSELDFIVHAISYSDRSQLSGPYLKTSRDNFRVAMDVSCYSLTAIAQRALPKMSRHCSLLTLTYAGSRRVIPNYNVMGVAKAALEASVRYLAVDLGRHGVRVNAISAGPVRTLAASGIENMRQILRWNELNAPLKRNVSIQDVGNTALYLLSDLSRNVTGEIIHVDAGYHVVGMLALDEVSSTAAHLASIGAKQSAQ